ncbi:uncharacterized protein LOC125228613 [Leguminivora glycinivorella]|uniref:uncharacterized protein LOC125228613 n=1 Tax=Leguminivora glycinivorella TaxID=1035111 RepID=UPI00200C000D|nr:uncharacterized protein LOC125228613 [Leguminivora glycinivorella]
MPRKYVRRIDARRYKAYTEDALEECLRAIESKVLTQRKAAAQFNIPRRTLINRIKARKDRKKVGGPGFPPIFNDEEELHFCDCVERMGQYGFPLSELDLRMKIKLVKKVGQYVVFMFEGEIFPGVITKISGKGPTISAMQRSLKNWKWPKPKDEIMYKWADVLGGINVPKKVGRREFYSIPELDYLWTV